MSLALVGIRIKHCPNHSLVTIQTELQIVEFRIITKYITSITGHALLKATAFYHRQATEEICY
jgi:hypothetical protein